MNKLDKRLTALVLMLLATTPALAATYALAGGAVSFNAPDAWPAMMEKTSGDPQFYAFQIRNPQAPDTLSRIVVTTHKLQQAGDFQAFATQELGKAEHSKGFKAINDGSATANSTHFLMDEDGHPQLVRLYVFRKADNAITLRCVRPESAKASNEWLQAYEQGCQTLVNELSR